MKQTLITFFTVLLCLSASVVWSGNIDNLVMRDGIIYKKFTEKPFTGSVIGLATGKVEEGIKVGEWTFWHKNGQLGAKGFFLNNKMEGSWSHYLEDGKLNWYLTGTYKNGKKISD
mgnify:CR=1 FL=1|tara:strand:+ start:784 stop:1128 length:345 start_codon:yes stop_codon:yes gene_type:complete